MQPTFVQVRRNVHHSYIWLGSFHTLAGLYAVLLVLLFVYGPAAMEEVFGSSYVALLPLLWLGAVVLFLLVFGIVLASRLLSYRHLYYELTDTEFNFHSGIFSKKRIHVPYQRIQSLDQNVSLLQRIAGVCTVRIDTAGGSNNTAIFIPYLLNSDAEWLRHELFARKNVILASSAMRTAAGQGQVVTGQGQVVAPATPVAPGTMPQVAPSATFAPGVASVSGTMLAPAQAAPAVPAPTTTASGNVLDAPANFMSDMRGVFGGAQVYTGTVTYEHSLSNRELLLTGLSNNTSFVVIVLAILGVLATVIELVVSFNITSSTIDFDIDVSMNGFVGIAPFIAIGMLLTLAFIWFVALLHSCLAYGGFKACRRDRRIEVEHGLLQHHFSGLDIDRVQSVIIKQSFIRRILGYCELSLGKIDAIEPKADEHHRQNLSRGLVIHPFVKLDRVPEILAGLVPEFANVPTQTIPVAPVALRRAIIRRITFCGATFWTLVFLVAPVWTVFAIASCAIDEPLAGFDVAVSIALVMTIVLIAVLLIRDVIAAILWYRGSSFAFNRDFMQISNSGFSRESVSFPRKKIQFGFVRTNPLQRRAHVATIIVRTAAGIMGSTLHLNDVSENDADAWLEWVKPGGNVLQ